MGVPIPLPLARKHPDAPGEKTLPPSFPQAGCRGLRPRRGYSESPAILSESLTCLSKEGAGNPMLRREVQGVSPCTQKRWRAGRWDNGAGQSRPSAEGGRRPKQIHPPRLCPTPLAKYERLCYSIPMKSADSPLLLLGACRITYVPGEIHRESPCGRSAEGTTQGARPSEEGWDRSECRCKAQAPWSYPAPRRFRDEYATDTRRVRDRYATLPRRLRDTTATPSCLQTPKSSWQT